MKKKNVVLITAVGIVAIMLISLVSGTVSNKDIAGIAIGYKGQTTCQCKCFVQRVVNEAPGPDILGTGYTQCYFDIGGTEIVELDNVMWGDIIQLSKDVDPEEFYNGMHTAIVLENYKNGNFKIVDSNYNITPDNIVRIHDWNPFNRASKYSLQVHFYRLGTTDYWDFEIPTYTQGWEDHNCAAYSVETDGRYRIDPEQNDPWIQLDGLLLDSTKYNAIEINTASNCPDGNARIYFTTTDSPTYGEDKKVEFKINNDGNWRDYTIYMANHNL